MEEETRLVVYVEDRCSYTEKQDGIVLKFERGSKLCSNFLAILVSVNYRVLINSILSFLTT